MSRTYIAPGLLDLHLVIHAGSAWLTVEFKGGHQSGYGDYAATFTTCDPSLQFLIENSPEFRTGRICLQT